MRVTGIDTAASEKSQQGRSRREPAETITPGLQCTGRSQSAIHIAARIGLLAFRAAFADGRIMHPPRDRAPG